MYILCFALTIKVYYFPVEPPFTEIITLVEIEENHKL